MEATPTPLVLIGAGIGVTPLVSMLAEAVANCRPTSFVHVARHGRTAPLLPDIERHARHPDVRLHRVLTRPSMADVTRGGLAHVGRLTARVLETLLPKDAGDFCLCGPTGFVKEVETFLAELGVASSRIHVESFG